MVFVAPPVATPLPRNVPAAKDPLIPNRLRVTPLDPRLAQNSKYFIISMCYYVFLSHNLIFIAIASG
jgi:hypothetical protein